MNVVHTPADQLRVRLRQVLSEAIKARDMVAMSALRTVMAAIDNAEAPPAPGASTLSPGGTIAGAALGVGSTEVARCVLTREQLRALMQAQIAERLEAALQYERVGKQAEADRLRAEAGAVRAQLD